MSHDISPYDHLNGFYRPGLSFPEQLVATTIGRSELINELKEKLLQEDDSEEAKRNYMIMGQPGVGKTHFIRILGTLTQQDKAFNDRYVVIQFPEENHRILTFADLLLGIVEIFGHITSKKEWVELHRNLTEIQDDTELIETAIPSLENYCKSSKKNLLIFLENIDVFFRGQLRDNKNVKQFRKFITKSSFVTFIGTSQYNLIKSDELRKSPFSLFDIHILEVLDNSQTIQLIKRMLEWDNNETLINNFEELIPRINALYEMSGGNPRLSLILYELIAKENKWDIKKQIEKLLDQTTPFFRERMRSLAPQERALLETIALVKLDLKTSTSIAKSLRQSQQQTSNHLNKLQKAGYLFVADNPADKRSKIFRLTEGFFGLWLAIGHSREQNIILPRLVEFLEQWYAEKSSREKKRQQIWSSLRATDQNQRRPEINNQEQLLKYLSDIGSAEEMVQCKFELTHYFLTVSKPKEAKQLLKEIQQLSFEKPDYFGWMIKQCKKWILHGIEPVVLQIIEDIIETWHIQKNQNSETLIDAALKLINSFFVNRYYELIESYAKDILRFINNDHWRVMLLERVAMSQEKLKEWNKSLNTWGEVLKAAEKSGNLKSQGTIHNNISQIHQDLGQHEIALDHLRESLKTLSAINDYDGQGTTLNNISTIHFEQGYYEKALERLEQALSIARISQNSFIEGITLSNISLIYQARGDHEKALECLKKSLVNMKRLGNRTSECITLNNISQIHLELDKSEKSLSILKDAYAIAREIDNKQCISLTLYNTGKTLWAMNKQNDAMLNWVPSYKIAENEGLKEILAKFSQLAESFGQDGRSYWRTQLKEYSVRGDGDFETDL